MRRPGLIRMSLAVMVLVACTAVAGAGEGGAAPRGSELLKKYELFDIEKTPCLYGLDVVGYYGLNWKYNTPAKKEEYRQTEPYRKQLADLEKIRARSSETRYYTPVFKKLLENTKPGVLQVHLTDVYVPDYPFAIAAPNPLTSMEGEVLKSQGRYLNRRYFIQTYDVPLPEETKEILATRGKVNLYLVFTAVGMKRVSDSEDVLPARDVVSVRPIRFIAVLDGSDELLADREL